MNSRRLVAFSAAFGVVAFALWTFVALSYRDDTFGFWKAKHFKYPVQKTIPRKLFYIVHRISAVLWTCFIAVHLILLFATGRRVAIIFGKATIPIHEILGWGVVASDLANIVTGVIALAIQPFTDLWSTVFVSINALYNSVLIVCFVLSRCDVLIPRKWHRYIGFGFLVSVLGFLIQSNLFFTMIYASTRHMLAKWHLALVLALPLSIAASAIVCGIYELWFSSQSMKKEHATKTDKSLEQTVAEAEKTVRVTVKAQDAVATGA